MSLFILIIGFILSIKGNHTFMPFFILIIGFMFLIKGADKFVEGSSALAYKFNVPPMVIGLTIVAMGTSAPEAAVSITSSLAGQNDMSIANVIGSNFFNTLVVLGVSAIITKLPVQNSIVKRDTPFLVVTCALLVFFSSNLTLDRINGSILLVFFIIFLIGTIRSAISNNHTNTLLQSRLARDESALSVEYVKKTSLLKILFNCVLGGFGIILGGNIVVNAASDIAMDFGMSANLVGLTIVALGTSLPEFVTSIVAIRKGETDIAVGNVIGSNLFNILLVLGLASFIDPIIISTVAFIDIIFLTIVTTLLYLFIKRNNSLSRLQGIILVMIYIMYISYTIIR